MAVLRIATYNVEWMNNLFVKGAPRIRAKGGTAMGRNPIKPRVVAQRIASVIDDLDAHIVGIQEGPSRLEQMQSFADEFLGKRYTAHGYESGAQSVYVLVRSDCPIKVTPIETASLFYKQLTKPVVFQPWGSYNSTKTYKMARPPALLRLGTQKDGYVHLVVAHTKSQFVKGFSRKKLEARTPDAMKQAIAARQKLSADIAAYRRHVTHVILSQQARGAIVMGDLNDGFGRSLFEKEFLLQSLVDELRGSFRRQSALLDHVMDEKQLNNKLAYTVSFRSPEKKGVTKELIDHILVTPQLKSTGFWMRLRKGSAKIEHAISSAHTVDGGAKADDRPSDHVPVTAEFLV